MDELYGLVLAGGKSARMGKDKSLIHYHGKPQREFLFDLLSEFCSKVFTSCRSEQHVPGYLNPLIDSCEVGGPLNGILSAFSFASNKAWIAVAVDMPNVKSESIRLLVDGRDPKKAATCFVNPADELPEPLITLWEPRAFPLILELVKTGDNSPRSFLIRHPVKKIKAEGHLFLNINYPDQSD
jgi:molybdopterin-guanine dinucleotide biosynthesis protein A